MTKRLPDVWCLAFRSWDGVMGRAVVTTSQGEPFGPWMLYGVYHEVERLRRLAMIRVAT